MIDKFVYQAGDLIITDHICDGCIYALDTMEKCKKYEKKPESIIKCENNCRFYDYKGRVKLD